MRQNQHDRVRKFKEWRELCAKKPTDFKIAYNGARGEFASACLMKKIDGKFYIIESLEHWYFKNEEII